MLGGMIVTMRNVAVEKVVFSLNGRDISLTKSLVDKYTDIVSASSFALFAPQPDNNDNAITTEAIPDTNLLLFLLFIFLPFRHHIRCHKILYIETYTLTSYSIISLPKKQEFSYYFCIFQTYSAD